MVDDQLVHRDASLLGGLDRAHDTALFVAVR